MKDYHIETKCVQSGYQPKNGQPRIVPIIQSTTYKYDSSEQMARLFDLEEDGYFYTRLSNPTNDAVAKKIADLEGGIGAVLTSSGQAAIFFAVFNICEKGDHIVCSSSLYGGTHNLFFVTMKRMGIDVTLVSPYADEATLMATFRPETKVMFGETISNPLTDVLDIELFARVAHQNGVPLIVDNTFATPIHCRPFDWGADIIVHSTSKYMDGHAATIGGCVVDSGNFDWLAHDAKYPGLTTPDASYHGIVYAKRFGRAAYLQKLVVQLMRDIGAPQSPQHAFIINIGLETLHLRMRQHAQNALAVAHFLQDHRAVSWVRFPELEGDPAYLNAKKYLPDGSCGVLCFGLDRNMAACTRFMDALCLASIVTHVCDARSSILNPASHTHRQMSKKELQLAGISPDLIRFSVGIEHVDDIILDLEQALDNI